jgi:hypothetical protein
VNGGKAATLSACAFVLRDFPRASRLPGRLLEGRELGITVVTTDGQRPPLQGIIHLATPTRLQIERKLEMKTRNIIALLIAAVLAVGMFAGCDSNNVKTVNVRFRNTDISGNVDVSFTEIERDSEKVTAWVNMGLSNYPDLDAVILYVGDKPITNAEEWASIYQSDEAWFIGKDDEYTITLGGDHKFTFITDQQPKSIRINFAGGSIVIFDTETKKVIE